MGGRGCQDMCHYPAPHGARQLPESGIEVCTDPRTRGGGGGVPGLCGIGRGQEMGQCLQKASWGQRWSAGCWAAHLHPPSGPAIVGTPGDSSHGAQGASPSSSHCYPGSPGATSIPLLTSASARAPEGGSVLGPRVCACFASCTEMEGQSQRCTPPRGSVPLPHLVLRRGGGGVITHKERLRVLQLQKSS